MRQRRRIPGPSVAGPRTAKHGDLKERDSTGLATDVSHGQGVTGDVGETAAESEALPEVKVYVGRGAQADVSRTAPSYYSTVGDIGEAAAAPAEGAGEEQDSGVNIEVPTTHLTLKGHAPSVSVGKGKFRVESDDRIRLSGPSAILVSKVKRPHATSRQRLERLREKLDALHGVDAPESPGNRNTQVFPFSQDDLETLQAIVDAAIRLHQAPVLSRPIIDALESIRQHLEKTREVLEEAAKTFRSLGGLAGEISRTCLAIKELIDIFTNLPGS